MDFTTEKYRQLLVALKRHGRFTLRHDVDLRPDFSLRIAEIEAAILGIGIRPLATKLYFTRHDAIARSATGKAGWQAQPSMPSSPSGAISPE